MQELTCFVHRKFDVRSSLVRVKYCNMPTMDRCSYPSFKGLPENFDNVGVDAIGVVDGLASSMFVL